MSAPSSRMTPPSSTKRSARRAGSPPSDYRIAEDGELRAAFDLLVEMGLLIFDSEQDGWAPEDPTSVQSRVVSPLSQEAAKLLSESSQWSSAFSNLAQSWRRAPQSSARGPFTYLRGVELINSVLDQLLAECEEELLTAQPEAGRDPRFLAKAALRDIELLERGVDDAHALPAQRPAQLGHPQVRRRRDRAGCRGAHPRRVLQPDDRGRPPGRGDPQPATSSRVAVVDPRAGGGGLPRRRLRALLGARPARSPTARPR